MTQSAVEVFTTQLGRAASRSAHKFLRSRGLQRSDRDDVTAAAMLWCWEHRHKYSLTTTLETWFMNAIRDAYKALQRDDIPISGESLENMGGGDDTYNRVAAESFSRVLFAALTPVDRQIARLIQQGFTYAELVDKGYSNQAISNARQRIKQLRRLLPDTELPRFVSRTAAPVSSDDAGDGLSDIDRELERLEFAPAAGKDCPPCWRCMWFEGFMPDGKRSIRMEIEDTEVREAVTNTEARKIDIAQQVRDGV